MSKIEEFKSFVRKNPILINHVKANDMTWQKFYEIYDLYGEDNTAWKEFLVAKEESKEKKSTVNEFLNMAKNMDVDKVQESITSVQKALALFGDLFTKETPTTKSTYKPRPIYRSFED